MNLILYYLFHLERVYVSIHHVKMESDQVVITMEEGTMSHDIEPSPPPTNFFGSIISGVKDIFLVNDHSPSNRKEEPVTSVTSVTPLSYDPKQFLDNPRTAVDFINSLGMNVFFSHLSMKLILFFFLPLRETQ